ncbi:MAG: preprotein translocase subunit SecA [Candidatus Brocadia fulgida]|uniref:Preprotein translocase subunit SecA n=1 Tax=Candidatus Brocadia fulgida TaxID=380242 RepID=A0A0M2UUF5_9BACT|nr:MAG: preprotein translocase subunit SecA [Candidatus Brocadia fulgida]
MFEGMNLSIRDEVTDLIFKLQLGKEAERKEVWHPDQYVHQEVSGLKTMQESPVPAGVPQNTAADAEEQAERKIEPLKVGIKIGRNQPCPCGSGKKFKQCCGRVN